MAKTVVGFKLQKCLAASKKTFLSQKKSRFRVVKRLYINLKSFILQGKKSFLKFLLHLLTLAGSCLLRHY